MKNLLNWLFFVCLIIVPETILAEQYLLDSMHIVIEADSSILSREIYTYDSTGFLIAEEKYCNCDQSYNCQTNEYRFTYTNNLCNNTIIRYDWDTITNNWNNGSFYISSICNYNPNKIIEIERSSSMDPWAYKTNKEVQYYDSAENIIKEISYKNPSEASIPNWEPYVKLEYTYNNLGQLIEERVFAYTIGVWILAQKTIIQYNHYHLKEQKEVYQLSASGSLQPYTKNKYYYDNRDSLVLDSTFNYDSSSSNWEYSMRIVMIRDTINNHVDEYSILSDTTFRCVEYQYNDKGLLEEIIRHYIGTSTTTNPMPDNKGNIYNRWLYFYSNHEEEEVGEDIYVILTRRNNNSNWFYLTSYNSGTEYTPHLEAINSGTMDARQVPTNDLEDKYKWEIIEVEDNTLYLKSQGLYLAWSSGNTAYMSQSVGVLLTKNENDVTGYVQYYFVDPTGAQRFLSLNKDINNNYFSFYKGTQAQDLLVIPYGALSPTGIERNSEQRFASKIIEDGCFYILLPDGTKYNATGKKVE